MFNDVAFSDTWNNLITELTEIFTLNIKVGFLPFDLFSFFFSFFLSCFCFLLLIIETSLSYKKNFTNLFFFLFYNFLDIIFDFLLLLFRDSTFSPHQLSPLKPSNWLQSTPHQGRTRKPSWDKHRTSLRATNSKITYKLPLLLKKTLLLQSQPLPWLHPTQMFTITLAFPLLLYKTHIRKVLISNSVSTDADLGNIQ